MVEDAQGINCPIAVIGVACWYPGAANVVQLWENVLTRRAQFRTIPDVRLPMAQYYDPDPAARDRTYCQRAGLIDGFAFDWAARHIPRSTFASSDLAHWLALEVAIQAMADTGLAPEAIPRLTTSVIVGNTLTGEFSRADTLRERWPYVARALRAAADAQGIASSARESLVNTAEAFFKSVFPPATEDTLAGHLSNTIAGRICNHFDLHGGGYTVDGACSSSLIAVATAATALANHDADLSMVGGVDISLDPFELVGFARMGALTKDQMRVYDGRASGFIPGEGCGFAVLQRLDDARAAGNRVLAVIHGWGVSSDGKGVGLTAPSAPGQALAISRAYARAPYAMTELDFIEGHGTGTSVGDVAEVQAVGLAMGNDAQPRSCGIGTVKSIVGHTKSASGICGFIKAVLAVNRRIIPPTANCTDAHPVFHGDGLPLYPLTRGQQFPADVTLRTGVSAMGFGGINCHVTMSSADPPSPALAPSMDEGLLMLSRQETEVFPLAADTVAALADSCRALAAKAEGMAEGEMPDLAAVCAQGINAGAAVRAALVAATPDELMAGINGLLHALDGQTATPGFRLESPDKTWICGSCSDNVRVAFVFPGQGSQMPNMARTLIERHEWARALAARADAWVREINPDVALLDTMFRATDRLPDDTELAAWKRSLAATQVTQPALCLASMVWTKFLAMLGIRPVSVAGHSLGELTAFWAAGLLDDRALIRIAALRGKLMAAASDAPGAMAALACNRVTCEGLLSGIDGYVVLANINSPRQTVVSGERAAVDAVIAHAAARGIETHILPVSSAFHSRMIATAAAALGDAPEVPTKAGTPTVPLYSCCDGRTVEAGRDVRRHLSGQMLSPVDFVSVAQALRGTCDLMVEAGCGKVLSGLVNDIHAEGGPPCLPLESKPGRDRDLNSFVAQYFVRGGEVAWDALTANRLLRPFVPAAERVFIMNPCERAFAVDPATLPPPAVMVNTTLAERIGIPVDKLEEYLTRRGSFLADMIRADEHSQPDLLEPTPAAQQPATETANPVAPAEAPAAPQSVEVFLRGLVAEVTGFSAASIGLDMRLIDDLNLDSIKAASLIAEAAKRRGIAGTLDPFLFANKPLSELAEVLTHQVIPATTPDATDTTWLRSFVMADQREDLADDDAACHTYWRSRRTLVLHEPEEQSVADAVAASLKAHGATVTCHGFDEADARSGAEWHALVAILPKHFDSPRDTAEVARAAVKRLHAIGTLGTSASIDGIAGAVCIVQWTCDAASASLAQQCAGAFAASLHLERPAVRVRALTFARDAGQADVARCIVREAATEALFARVTYSTGMIRHMPTPVLSEKTHWQRRSLLWSSRDVVLVTGGAKGITALCTFSFAEATGARVALVGRSPMPQNGVDNAETAATLDRFKARGLDARYFSCDVSNAESVATLIRRITDQMGPVTAVFHGAALNIPRNLDDVGAADAFSEIAPKVCGGLNLLASLEGIPLKLFVGFSSIIGTSGMPRNAWYGFSNEALDLLIARYGAEHPGTAAVSIAFSVWQDVGMGVKLGSTHALARFGIDAIPVRDGIAAFLDLLDHDPGTTSIAVAARLGFMDTLRQENMPLPPAHRFIEEVVRIYPRIEAVVRARLSVARDPYLADHQWQGSPLFPTVHGCEAMAQVAAYLTGNHDMSGIRIENLILALPIAVPSQGATIEIRALALERTSSHDALRVNVAIHSDQTGFAQAHFSATFIYGAALPRRTDFRPVTTPLAIIPQRDLYGPVLFQGACFQRLHRVYELDSSRCVFAIDTSPDGENGEQWLLGNPYVRDVLLQSAQLLFPAAVALPTSIGVLQRYAAVTGGQRIVFGVTTGAFDMPGRTYRVSVSAVADDGTVIEELDGYCGKVLDIRHERPAAEDLAAPDARDERLLADVLRQYGAALNVTIPHAGIAWMSGLGQNPPSRRHARAMPVLRRVGAAVIDTTADNRLHVQWMPSGQPVLRNVTVNGAAISIAHDEYSLLVIAGIGPQGCDIEPIVPRDTQSWRALLGPVFAPLFDRVVAAGEEGSQAGTRVWTAREAAAKALSDATPQLAPSAQQDSTMLWSARSNGTNVHILTFPLRLTLGPKRMVAVTVTPRNGSVVTA